MKSLVIYYSRCDENYMAGEIKNIDKGNTEIVSEYISDITGADLFKVECAKEYPYKYDDCCMVAKEELMSDARPVLKSELNNINDYDVIYIGGPVWWGHFPCGIFTLLEKLDFKGKIVKPFTTHEGSGLGNVMEDINRFCIGADIKDGLCILGSNAKSSKDIIENWCKL